MEKLKILIVEDDETASYIIESSLYDAGFDVKSVTTVTEGLSYLQIEKYNLLILDLNLPDFNGFDLLSNKKIDIPTIIVSAYSDTKTKVKAFRFGADDYLSKPIDIEELEARIWALLRRNKSIITNDKPEELFEIRNNYIFMMNKEIMLTSLEFNILSYFINNKNKLISRDKLLENISSKLSHRLLDNHISNIRKKIEPNNKKPIYLKTEYGMGYKFIS